MFIYGKNKSINLNQTKILWHIELRIKLCFLCAYVAEKINKVQNEIQKFSNSYSAVSFSRNFGAN